MQILGWEKVMPDAGELPFKGDTVIGHDVWIGYDALIMPGDIEALKAVARGAQPAKLTGP